MRYYKVVFCGILLHLGALGCTEDGTVMDIRYSPTPETSCTFSSTQTSYRSRGVLDLFIAASSGYLMPLIIRNNMELVQAERGAGFADATANTVNIMGFDVCWIRGDTPNFSGMNSHQKGSPIDCDAVSADQKRFVASSGQIAPDGSQSVISFEVLSLADLRAAAIFGGTFNPFNIPFRGQFTASGTPYFSFLADPSAEARTDDWGNFPPDTTSAEIVLQIRAVGKTKDGRTVQSNWFSHPIDVCLGCVLATCGNPQVESCPGGGESLLGHVFDFEDACLPAQGYTNKCAIANGC